MSSDGDPSTIQTLLSGSETPTKRIRRTDRTRIQSALTIVDTNFADLEEFIDGDLQNDPFFIVETNQEEDVRRDTFEVYRLLHNYLSALYSFNEAIRVTVTKYLADDAEFSVRHYDPSRRPGVDYIRRLMFLRGLRIAAQHGAFSDVLPVTLWDTDECRYRIGFDEPTFCQTDTINDAGKYLRFTGKRKRKRPLKYVGSFHHTNLHPFYDDCRAWFDLR